MFNGIIHNRGLVFDLIKTNQSIILRIKTDIKLNKKEIGSSICCNGACLTLVKINKNILDFYLSYETLNKTNFKDIKKGDLINIEKSIKFGNKISGHYVQGHVDFCSFIKNINIKDEAWNISIHLPKSFKKMIIYKGSISINGVSLTISKLNNNSFEIAIIPHTLKITNLFKLKKNTKVNIEIDIFSKYLFNLNK